MNHIVLMQVRIPSEEWEAFKEQERETGHIQFKFRNATIYGEIV